jgi:hypothetical protein
MRDRLSGFNPVTGQPFEVGMGVERSFQRIQPEAHARPIGSSIRIPLDTAREPSPCIQQFTLAVPQTRTGDDRPVGHEPIIIVRFERLTCAIEQGLHCTPASEGPGAPTNRAPEGDRHVVRRFHGKWDSLWYDTEGKET